MPSIPVLPPASDRGKRHLANPLPPLLQTPSGLALLEIQGDVLSEDGESGISAALQLGKLVFPIADDPDASRRVWDGKRVFLFIGKHQRMTGEVKKLAKPIAVMRRKPASVDNVAAAATDEVEVAEIIQNKLLFAHRPEPVGAQQEIDAA